MVRRMTMLLIVLACLFLAASCAKGGEETPARTVRYEGMEVTVAEGEEIAEPAPPERAHETFAGWFLDEGLTQPAVFPFRVEADTVFYAKWVKAVYVVRFDSLAIPAEYGSKLDAPKDPVREHYAFSGWYLDAALTKPVVFPYLVTGDAELYAKWEPEGCTVRFTGHSELTALYGDRIDAPVPERTGSVFCGWYLNEGLTQPAPFPYTVEGDAAFYPKWELESYRVVFTGVEEYDAEYGSAVDPPDAVRPHETFYGWYLDENLTQPAAFPYTVEGDVTFYPKWEPVLYDVRFLAEGVSALRLPYGAEVGLPEAIPAREHYDFSGWYLDEGLTQPATFPYTVEGNADFYPKWTPKQYAVVFSGVGQDAYAYGTEVQPPAPPEREHEDFAGWYLDESLTEPAAFPYTVEGDAVFYAKWTPKAYRVAFTGHSETKAAYGSQIAEPEPPEREGYSFTGWYRDEAFTEPAVFPVTVEGETVFYPAWSRNAFAVDFEGVGVQNVPEGECVPVVPTPVRAGMQFAGWLDAATRLPYDFTQPIVRPMRFEATFCTPGLAFSDGKVSGAEDSGGKEVVIPAYYFGMKVTGIADAAFYNAETRKGWKMSAVRLPDTIERIGSEAFRSCGNLSDVTIPASVVGIGANAFTRCVSLTFVHCKANARPAGISENFIDPELVYVEWGCTCLEENGFRYAVYGGGAVVTQYLGGEEDVTVPAMLGGVPVTAVGPYAFWYSWVASVTLPQTVTEIGEGAFYSCDSLAELRLLSAVPPRFEAPFCNAPETLAVVVPPGAAEEYAKAEWNAFTIVEG